MPDPFGDEPKKDEKKEDPNAKILETLTSLKEELTGVTTRLDDFDARINELKTTPSEPATGDEEEHFRPKDWDEVPAKAQEIAETVVEEKIAAMKEEEAAKTETEKKQQQAMDTYIDTQLGELEKSNLIPKVEKADDENDKGRIARREVLGLATRMGTLNIKGVTEYLDMLHKSGYSYDPRADNMKGAFLRSGTTPSGINAPVASSSRSSGFVSGKPDYKAIHNARSLDAIVQSQMGE